MSVISRKQAALAASSSVPPRGYWRRRADDLPARVLSLSMGTTPGRLQVDALLGTDTHSQRRQAKETDRQWAEASCLPDAVSVPLKNVPDAARPQNVTRLGSDAPIRLVTSLEALLTLLQRTPLVVLDKQPPLSARVLGREPRGGWRAAVSVLDTGMRFQLRRAVLEAAQTDGRIHEEPVWQERDGERPWVSLYPMTSRWLAADQVGHVTLGRRLSLG